MSTLLPFIIAGIATGSVYALAATGLVLTFRTSGIFNFAQGAVAAAAAYSFYWLNQVHGMQWIPAALISVLVFGPAAGFGMERIAKNLSRQLTAWKIVGTIGIVLVVEGITTVKFGANQILVPQFLPKGSKIFRLGGANITYGELIIFIFVFVAVAVLYWLLRSTRLGVSMRAVVDDPELVSLHGKSPRRIRLYAWIIGTTFAAISGILVAPLVGIQAIVLTYLVVQAFGAAAIGTFSNIPLTFAGALFLGVAASVSTKYVVQVSWLQGLPESLPFIALLIVMLVTPARRLFEQSTATRRAPTPWRGPPAGRATLAIVLVAFFVIVPVFAGSHLTFFTVGLSQALLLLSLGLLVRTAGMVSLCQAAFAAIGAVAFAQFSANLHLPWLVAALLGAMVVVPVAALVALPAIRLSGVFLALATFGFGIMVEQMFYPMNFMFTVSGAGREMPRPSFASSDKQFYYLVLIVVLVFCFLMYLVHRARIGRMLQGMAESPLAIRTLGLHTNTTRIIVFCIAGFMAGLGGILYGSAVHFASASDSYYASFYSLVILAVLALAPMREPWYAVFAVIAAIIPGYLNSANTTSWLNVVFGIFAVVVALNGGPQQAPQFIKDWCQRIFGGVRLPEWRHTSRQFPIALDRHSSRSGAEAGLRIENLEVRYGGHIALHDVSLKVSHSAITGLIGPNGAGKTTLFNVCSGIVRPSTGVVLLHGEDVTRMGSAARGNRGLGRTFQIMKLCDSLTVAENVSLGCEAGQAGGTPWRQLISSRRERRIQREAVREALELCGISELEAKAAGNLSTGQRRLVELARCLAGSFDVLLLDEPSSGLDSKETERFAATLRRVIEERQCGILLVEHDMSLVMSICSYVYVLDFGELLFEGSPDVVANSPLVQSAYLGTEVLADVPSGSSGF